MQSMKPGNYNELMQYMRCLTLKNLVPEVDDEIFLKIYRHMTDSKLNSVGVSEGKLVFYEGEQAIDSIAVAMAVGYTAIRLSAAALDIERPVSHYSSSDSGSSGNNNNNNNNNNG